MTVVHQSCFVSCCNVLIDLFAVTYVYIHNIHHIYYKVNGVYIIPCASLYVLATACVRIGLYNIHKCTK